MDAEWTIGVYRLMMKAKTKNPTPPLRKSFLIRCWQQEGEWRFMLEDVVTRERQAFIGVAEMMSRLTAVLEPTETKNESN